MAKMQIKRVGVFSVAKIMGIVMAAFGLLIGVIYGLMIMTVGAAMMMAASSRSGGPGAGIGIVGGLIAMIAIPIFYGIIGFIIGLIYGVAYNVASGVVGGIELELENVEATFVPPPPQPQQWDANQYRPGQQQNYPY